MRYLTLLEMRQKIERDLDLQGEEFVTAEEINSYLTEGVDAAEAEIHTLYEDYFLSRETLTIVPGQNEYDLPLSIYAHKIRRVIYSKGNKTYTVKRLRDWKKFEQLTELMQQSSTADDILYYLILNVTPGAPKIVLAPAPTALSAGTSITIWFIRNANHLVNDTDICDIPEFASFVMQYAKVRCYEKEGHPNVQKAMSDLDRFRVQMQATLSDMVPDTENDIEMDLSAYRDMN